MVCCALWVMFSLLTSFVCAFVCVCVNFCLLSVNKNVTENLERELILPAEFLTSPIGQWRALLP